MSGEAETAFIEMATPEGSVLTGYVAITAFIDVDGREGWRYAAPGLRASDAIGLMAMASHDLAAKAFGDDDDD